MFLVCYVALYSLKHDESPFSSLRRSLFPKSPGDRVIVMWIVGVFTVTLFNAITTAVYSNSSSLESQFCASHSSDRFSCCNPSLSSIVAWIAFTVCNEVCTTYDPLLLFLTSLLYLSCLAFLFLLSHYKQTNPSASFLPLFFLFVALVLFFPTFLRCCYYLLPSIHLFSSAFSFPFVLLFHDLFPSNVVFVFSLALKLLLFLDSVQFVSLISCFEA